MLKVTMMTTRKLCGMGVVMMIGTLLACGEIGGPPDRVFTSLEMSPPGVTLAAIEGLKTREFFLRALDGYGVEMDIGAPSLSSSDPGVATVTRTLPMWPGDHYIRAEVTAVAPGEATISATWTIGGTTKTATAIVTVESTEEWSLQVDPAPLTLAVGTRQEVQATVVDETGKVRMQLGPYAAFAADRNDVVVLLEECAMLPCPNIIYVLGVAPGEATIAAEFEGLSGRASVIVVP